MKPYAICLYVSPDYADRLAFCLPSLLRTCAHEIHIFTDMGAELGPMPDRVQVHPMYRRDANWALRTARKAESLLALMAHKRRDIEYVYHCDADCLLVRDPGELFDREFDIAVTCRPSYEACENEYSDLCPLGPGTYRLPVGSMWLRNTRPTIEFLRAWCYAQQEMERRGFACHYSATGQGIAHDMHALAEVLFVHRHHMNVLGLNTHIYNSHPLDRTPDAHREWIYRLDTLRVFYGLQPMVLHFPQDAWRDAALVERALMAAGAETFEPIQQGG